jgi:hypothetical protein
MTETDTAGKTPTSVIFLESLGQLRQEDPKKADQLLSELQFTLGAIAINRGLSLLTVVAQDIDSRIASGSLDSSYTPESFVAFIFSPDPTKQEVVIRDVMRRFILGEDNK